MGGKNKPFEEGMTPYVTMIMSACLISVELRGGSVGSADRRLRTIRRRKTAFETDCISAVFHGRSKTSTANTLSARAVNALISAFWVLIV